MSFSERKEATITSVNSATNIFPRPWSTSIAVSPPLYLTTTEKNPVTDYKCDRHVPYAPTPSPTKSCTSISSPPSPSGFVWWMKLLAVGLKFLAVVSFIAAPVFSPVGMIELSKEIPRVVAVPAVMAYLVAWAFWFVASVSRSLQDYMMLFGVSVDKPRHFWGGGASMVLYYTVDWGFEFILAALTFLVALYIVLVSFGCIFLWDSQPHKNKVGISPRQVSTGNAAFTAIIFFIYVVSYDSAGTHKPWWTELLG